jgi:hypothetical protein
VGYIPCFLFHSFSCVPKLFPSRRPWLMRSERAGGEVDFHWAAYRHTARQIRLKREQVTRTGGEIRTAGSWWFLSSIECWWPIRQRGWVYIWHVRWGFEGTEDGDVVGIALWPLYRNFLWEMLVAGGKNVERTSMLGIQHDHVMSEFQRPWKIFRSNLAAHAAHGACMAP